uniref:RNA-directed RNA polymerase n=1 Tax=Rhizoctonia solani phlegivirus 5 TaxID=3162549 RepID=A0A8F5AI13_9VIRU
MLRGNAKDNTLYLVHSPEDATALGAQLISFAIPHSSLLTAEDRAKHPDRADFFDMNKKNWRESKVLKNEFQYDDRNHLKFNILGKLLPYVMWDTDFTGARSMSDERTAYHLKRLEDAKSKQAADLEFLSQHSCRSSMLWDCVRVGITQGSVDLLSSALRCLYPETDASIMLRARAQPKLVAEFMIALHADRPTTLGRFISIAEQHIHGQSIVGFMGIMLYFLASQPRSNVIDALAAGGTFSHGMKHADNVLKPMHEDVRRAALVPNWAAALGVTEYTDLMYMTTIMGRYYNVTLADDGSVVSRTKFPGVHTASTDGETFDYETHMQTMDLVLDKLEHAAFNAISEKRHKTAADFHADFLSVASAGSAASGKAELEHVESDARMNKRAWLNELQLDDILGLVNRDPAVISNAVNKVELNKIRQLLPGPVWHWLGECIVLWGVEKEAFRADPYIALEKSPTTKLKRLIHRQHRNNLDPDRTTLDMDYADFNITHMISDMQKIYRTIKKAAVRASTTEQTWGDTDYAGFVSRTCDWLIDALEQLHMRADGGDGEIHHLVRGLWSGWRSTQFINTMENSNYFNQARLCLTETLGYDPIIFAEGQGDDMDAVLRSDVDALITVLYFQRCGHVMQPLKQLIGNYSSEFLRITAHDGKLFGNLSRTIGSYCSSDLQAPEIENGPTAVQGCNMAVHTLVRRGMDEDVAEILRQVSIRRFSEIRVYEHQYCEYNYHWMTPEMAAISGHDGGLNCNKFGELSRVRSFDLKRDAHGVAEDDTGLIALRGDWVGSQHLSTKYKGVKTHGTPRGAHNNGIKALKAVVHEYMTRRNINPEIVEEIQRAAEDATWQGLRDSSQERLIRDEYKAELVGFYKACRHLVSTKPQPEPELDPHMKSIAEQTLRAMLATEGEHADPDLDTHIHESTFRQSDIEDIISTALRVALGPASISSGLIFRLRDMGGNKLGLWEALQLLDSHAAGQIMASLNRYNLPEVVEYILTEGGHSIMDTGGMVTPELNLVIQNVQLAVISNTIVNNSVNHLTYGDWYRLMRATNMHIMQVYKTEYFDKYRM